MAVRAPHHQGPNTDKDAFNKREKAAEDMYMRDQEKEKLKALQKSIEASKAHLSKLEQDAKALESSISGKDKA
ncbi:ATPase inhibitor [Microbotryomycetes sp. JL201]|nr:ATPase inhibitor [Microbotryomycetes sp. JL201]